MRIEAGDDAIDQLRFDEGPRRVVDQHRGGRQACERFETGANQVLPSRAAWHGVAQASRRKGSLAAR